MSRNHTRWALVGLLAALPALAAPPPEFSVQGVLRNAQGTLQSGTVAVTANLYDAETAGNKIAGPFTKTGVPVTNGLFTVSFAEPTLPGVVAAAPAVWLELLVGSDTFPRTKITSAIFAAQSADAQKLGGLDAAGWQKRLATADCGAGKHVQAVAQDGTVTCAPGASADGTSITATSGGVLSVAFAGNGTAATAAHSDHRHYLSCTTVTASTSAAGGATATAFCPDNYTLTGGGCNSSTGFIRNGNPLCAGGGIFCICLPPASCNPRYTCTSGGGGAGESITAYAQCCTSQVLAP